MSRNQIFDSLLALGRQIEPDGPGSEWAESGRRMKTPDKCQMPCLLQVEGDSEFQSKLGQMPRRKAQVLWVVYQDAGKDQSVDPTVKTQDLIDLIEAQFAAPVNIQGLGGLVFAAFLDGAIRRYPGDLDGIEMITFPISILLP